MIGTLFVIGISIALLLCMRDLQSDREILKIVKEYSAISDKVIAKYIINDNTLYANEPKDWNKAIEVLCIEHDALCATIPIRLKSKRKQRKTLEYVNDMHRGWMIVMKKRASDDSN